MQIQCYNLSQNDQQINQNRLQGHPGWIYSWILLTLGIIFLFLYHIYCHYSHIVFIIILYCILILYYLLSCFSYFRQHSTNTQPAQHRYTTSTAPTHSQHSTDTQPAQPRHTAGTAQTHSQCSTNRQQAQHRHTKT